MDQVPSVCGAVCRAVCRTVCGALPGCVRGSAGLCAGLCAGHINETGPPAQHSSVCKEDRQVNKYLLGWETLALIKNTWQEQGTSSLRDPAKEEKMQTYGWCQVGTRLMGGVHFLSFINV